MQRLALALFTLSALALVSCGSDDEGGAADTTSAADTDDEAAPAGPADAESGTTANESLDTTATADTTAPNGSTAAETTAPADSSTPGDTTGITDGTDVVDETFVFDTTPDSMELPPVPTGSDVSPELCETLVSIHEWFEEFNAMEEEENTWQELQQFDTEDTPGALRDFETLTTQVPELEETVATATEFIVYLSGIIQAADSYEEGSELLFADQEKVTEMMDSGLALEAIDDYALSECVAP